jgi:hypothetical protein
MSERRSCAPPKSLLLVGRDPREAERMKRLLPARVGFALSPTAARAVMAEHGAPDVLLLEDRAWAAAEGPALEEFRALSAERKLSLVLARRRGEHGPSGHPVVQRPYDIEEIVSTMRTVLLRRKLQ